MLASNLNIDFQLMVQGNLVKSVLKFQNFLWEYSRGIGIQVSSFKFPRNARGENKMANGPISAIWRMFYGWRMERHHGKPEIRRWRIYGCWELPANGIHISDTWWILRKSCGYPAEIRQISASGYRVLTFPGNRFLDASGHYILNLLKQITDT